jgi:hypothetical protein
MKISWVLLALLVIVGLYLVQNPDFKSWFKKQQEEITSDAGLTKKTAVLYKWKNSPGEWQYTDQPPAEGTDFERLESREADNVIPLPPGLGGEQ